MVEILKKTVETQLVVKKLAEAMKYHAETTMYIIKILIILLVLDVIILALTLIQLNII